MAEPSRTQRQAAIAAAARMKSGLIEKHNATPIPNNESFQATHVALLVCDSAIDTK